MGTSIYLPLDDIGLFRERRRHEKMSQRKRAEQIRDQFAACMRGSLAGTFCIMPGLCAHNESELDCYHLTVDYSNFTGKGIPLTGHARTMIDSRLRAIGTLVYRHHFGPRKWKPGDIIYPGDVHIPSLDKIAHFTGKRREAAVNNKHIAKRAPPAPKGFFARLWG